MVLFYFVSFVLKLILFTIRRLFKGMTKFFIFLNGKVSIKYA